MADEKKITINVADLDRAINDNIDQHEQHFAGQTLMGVNVATATGGGIGGAERTFCTLWPKCKPFALRAIGMIGWLSPTIAAETTAVINAIDEVVVPLVCR